MIRIVPTGDLGLDVLTGGGWRLVKRFEERESACVVVRGGPGAGKSTLGIHVALELANALGGDVAVGCVEILPTEYVAQLQSTRPSLEAARVVQLPAPPAPLAEGTGPRVFIGLMTELDPARPDLAANLAALGAAVEAAGGKPTVFIVDSLIDGYGIGSSINRIDADATIKFAVQGGYALVLCEETVSDAPSPWVFAADTVLHLGVESRERGRWIEVQKHRFGPSASGRHELDLVGESGPEVFPAPHAWRAVEPQSFLPFDDLHLGRGGTEVTWDSTFLPKEGFVPLHVEAVLISANERAPSRQIADHLRSIHEASRSRRVWLNTLLLRDQIEADATLRLPDHIATHDGPNRALRRLVEGFLIHLSQGGDKEEHSLIVVQDIGDVLSSDAARDWAEALHAFALIVAESCARSALVLVDGQRGDGGAARAHVGRFVDSTFHVRSSHPLIVLLTAQEGLRVENLTWPSGEST